MISFVGVSFEQVVPGFCLRKENCAVSNLIWRTGAVIACQLDY